VALLDTVTDENGTRFVLVWRIEPKSQDNQGKTEEENLDEY
jgi:hypothetical protein